MKTSQDILSLLARGLEAAANDHTASSLGDRQTYLGMSDLARGLSCPRAVVADKLCKEKPGMSLEKLLQLRRGHWLEHGVEEALSALNTRYISQLEISVQHQGVPIKAHLDLVLPDEDSNSITVLELKSVGHLREHVYGSHEAQLYGQLGLLHRFWSQPVFSVGRQFGNGQYQPAVTEPCSFPELAGRHLGIKLAEDVDMIPIRGFVLAVSPKAAKAFGPYSHNGAVLDVLLETGKELLKWLDEIKTGAEVLDNVAHQNGFDPLCGWCRHNHDCPKFAGPDQMNLDADLSALANLKKERSSIDAEIKEREEQLKVIADLMSMSGQWINTLNYQFKVASLAGRVTLDQSLLAANLGQL